MITVVGIAGSPRSNGNSTKLLGSVLKGAESIAEHFTGYIWSGRDIVKNCA